MSGSRKRSRRRKPGPSTPADLWRPVPAPPDPAPVHVAGDPTALLRSLGPPPLPGREATAGHYFAAVIERASGLAVALAATAGLLEEEHGEPDE